jgi:tRNA(Ile)-lysidine synthase
MTESLERAMRAFSPRLPLALALSGGADSTALLLACAERWPGQVSALHVNHGLQDAAGIFEQHCVALCRRFNVVLQVARVRAHAAPGESPEEAARNARYRALTALARSSTHQPAVESIALAHHADDQVETILLALSRGAGLGGISAMPAQWRRDGLTFYRPLLGVSAADIKAWLAQREQGFVEDPSNTDESFTRNRIRAQLLPVLNQAFPQFRDTFARSAMHIGQALGLLEQLAMQDLALVCPGGSALPGIKALQALGRDRQANVLRYWLKTRHDAVPSAAQLRELQDQLSHCRTRAHQLHIKVGRGFVRRQAEFLDWYNPQVLL